MIPVKSKYRSSLIKRSNCQKLLPVKINTKSLFDDHIKDLRKKANSKLGALVRVTPNTGLAKKKKMLMNSFFKHSLTLVPQYGYSTVEATIIK